MPEVDEIIDKLFVLKKYGNRYLLPTTAHIEVELPGNSISFLYPLVRVLGYNLLTNELVVKPEGGNLNEKAFLISTEVNSELLQTYSIKKLRVEQTIPSKGNKGFNDDVQNRFEDSDNISEDLPLNENANQEKNNPGKDNMKKYIYVLMLSIKDIYFENGKATFKHFANELNQSIKFEVENPFLFTPLDAIKNYFPKALNIKKIKIEISYTILNGKLLEQSATSPDISSINEAIFEMVKGSIIDDHIIDSEDEMYSLVDKIKELPEAIKDNLNDTSSILNYLLDPNKTKHHYHLRYLSSQHLHKFANLRLTGKPLSFVFILENGNSRFLIWETYKTDEATYIWKLESDSINEIKKEIGTILNTIKWLRTGKKEVFLTNRPENFKRIHHNYHFTDYGFRQWQEQLLEFLTRAST